MTTAKAKAPSAGIAAAKAAIHAARKTAARTSMARKAATIRRAGGAARPVAGRARCERTHWRYRNADCQSPRPASWRGAARARLDSDGILMKQLRQAYRHGD